MPFDPFFPTLPAPVCECCSGGSGSPADGFPYVRGRCSLTCCCYRFALDKRGYPDLESASALASRLSL
jgi:hypothetical protein